MCWNDSHSSVILCGSTVKTAVLLDVEVDKILYQCDKQALVPLNGLLFADESQKFFTLSNNGSIDLWDPRTKPVAMHYDDDVKDASSVDIMYYAMDVSGNSCQDAKLTCVSRLDKQVAFYELRHWKQPLALITLDNIPETRDSKRLCVKVICKAVNIIFHCHCVWFFSILHMLMDYFPYQVNCYLLT